MWRSALQPCRGLLAALLVARAALASSTALASGEEVSADGSLPHVELRTVAFGSCNKQDREQPLWPAVQAFDADLWLWTGDAVYANNRTVEALREAMAQQRAHPGYAGSSTKLVEGVWDDHDFGINDAGKEVPSKSDRQNAFLSFLGVGEGEGDAPRRRRQGLYRAVTFGRGDHEVKLILLDTRSHRDLHAIPSLSSMPNQNWLMQKFAPLLAAASRWWASSMSRRTQEHDGDMLGAEQWAWLERQLAGSKAQFHVVVSSVQVLTTAPVFESWAHFPQAKARLLALLARHQPRGLLFLSGDVHFAEISAAPATAGAPGPPDPNGDLCGHVLEVTSSGMTHTCRSSWKTSAFCPWVLQRYDEHRLGGDQHFTDLNFGTLEFNWSDSNGPTLTASVRDARGQPALQIVRRACPLRVQPQPRQEDRLNHGPGAGPARDGL